MPGVDLDGLWRLPEDKVEQPATDPQQVQQLEQRLLEEIQGRQDDQPAADPRQSSLSLNLASDHQHKMMDTLGTNSHLLPSAGRIIHGEHYTALVRPMKRQRTFDGPQSLAIERQLSQIGSSDQANKAQELPQAVQTNPDELRDQFTSPDFPPSSGEPGPGHHPVPQLPDRSNAPKLEASALQAGRSTLVTVGADKRALYSEDASLIGVLDSALHQRRVSDNTIKLNVNPLLHFARWLVANGKQSFASRLDETSLNQDLQQYAASGGPSLEVAMGHLKTASAGDLPMAGRSFRNPHSLDGALIERYKATPSWNKLSGSTAKGYIYAITRLSDYLQRKGKMGIAPRLNQKSLNDDVKLYPGDYTTIEAALAHLRRSGAGESASRGNIAPFPHPAHAAARRVGGAAAQHRAPQRPANFDRRMWPTMEAAPAHSAMVPSDTFGGLQSFVDLNAPTPSDLHDDAHFAPAHSARAPSDTFGGLQSFVDLNAPTPSDLDDDAHFAPVHSARAPSGTFGGLQSFVDLNAPTPSDLHDDAHFAPMHSARAPSGTFGGLQSFVDLNAPTPSDLRDDAHFAPVHSARAPSGTFGGLQSFVDLNAPTPSDLRDDAHFAPAHSAGAPSGTFGGLQSFVDLNAPTPSDLRDDAHSAPVRRRGQMFGDMQRQRTIPETEAAAVKLMRTDDVQHRGQALPMSAPAAPARQPAMPATAVAPDTYRGLPLIDVTAPASPSSDARIGGLDRTASSRVAAGSVLGATEWLSDAHIQRDYDFLEQQLQGIDPALAARIRLVSPSVSHLLRHLGEDAGGTLQSIYHQSDAPADFLFLPVNNGTATRAGTHWSLLFVDGRNPQSRVAYHYDSLQQAGYNDAPARQLAEGLTATLAPARMPRQSNDHDCGVFVVDGTWALVQRLLDGNRPDHEPLHLDNLVADRQALQNRLTRL
ncbi:Ulp1 family isopeptidase [Mesorhizobium neociceri]